MGIFVAIVVLFGVVCGAAAVVTGQMVIPTWLLGVVGAGGLWLLVGTVSYRPSRRDVESEYHTRASAIDGQIQTMLSRAVSHGNLSDGEKVELNALYRAREENNKTWKG